MRKYHTESTNGCVLLGNDAFSFGVPNNYGDCRNTVIVFDSSTEYAQYLRGTIDTEQHYSPFEWVGSVCGSFNLYSCDCVPALDVLNTVAKLTGNYEIYLRSNDYELPQFAFVPKE